MPHTTSALPIAHRRLAGGLLSEPLKETSGAPTAGRFQGKRSIYA